MKREDIEKAAREYVKPTASIIPVAESIAAKEGFIHGALWHINSVWHDMKAEEPQVYGEYEKRHYPQIPCLVKGQLSTGYGHGVRYWNVTERCWDDEECDDYECEKDAIEVWAYLDDLLPNKEK